MQVGQGALYQLADLYGIGRPADTVQYGDFVNPDTGTFYDTTGSYGGGGGNEGLLGALFGLTPAGLLSGGGGGRRRGRDTRPTPGFATGAPGSPEDRRAAAMAMFQESPDYQFRLDEGLKALERSAAARGSLLSGSQLKAAQQYGGDLASGEYQNYTNQLARLAGFNTAPQTAPGLANLEVQAGQNIAGGEIGAANARASGFQDLLRLGSMAAGFA